MDKLFRNVLVPYDFSRHATRALRAAAELARAQKGRLLVVHVVPRLAQFVGIPPGGFPPAVVTAELVKDQQRRLEARVARTVGGRTPAVCRVVLGDPVQAILDAARGMSVIVMGTLGLTGVSRFVIGSVAERVVRHSPIPVVTMRAGARLRTRAARAKRRAA
jgi:nucleotide-binding universal stress UspA family protein